MEGIPERRCQGNVPKNRFRVSTHGYDHRHAMETLWLTRPWAKDHGYIHVIALR